MPELSLTLPGPIRSKKNSKRIFARGRIKKVLPSLAYEEWEARARKHAWQQAIVPPLVCPVEVTALIYTKGVLPDLSGALESVGDCLEGILWANDAVIVSWDGSRVFRDLENPRTEVIVKW
jgi:Holliday junction resolvase RusA-like endonuclease